MRIFVTIMTAGLLLTCPASYATDTDTGSGKSQQITTNAEKNGKAIDITKDSSSLLPTGNLQTAEQRRAWLKKIHPAAGKPPYWEQKVHRANMRLPLN